jgi:hypothetical protein
MIARSGTDMLRMAPVLFFGLLILAGVYRRFDRFDTIDEAAKER